MTAEALYEEYLTTPWSEPSRREREFLDAGEPLTLATEDGDVRGRRWRAESGTRGAILLAHGWAGRSSTWLVLAPMLNAAGLDVFAFDAPGHGETRGPEGPPRSSFFAFAATLLAAQSQILSSTPLRAVVGHSIGACTIPYALAQGLQAERAVLISPTAHTESFLTRWAAARGLSPEEEASVKQVWLAEFGEDVLQRTDPEQQARAMTVPALILHDGFDIEAPIEDGQTLTRAWPGATLEETTGLGHRRILLSRAAMGQVVEFVAS